MAYEETLRSITLTADASVAVWTSVPGQPGSPVDNAGNQYRFVKVTGVHLCGLALADNDSVVGVLQNKPQVTGSAATVGYQGASKVRAAGAITAGDNVGVSANGRAVTGGNAGIALTTVANADELVVVLLRLS